MSTRDELPSPAAELSDAASPVQQFREAVRRGPEAAVAAIDATVRALVVEIDRATEAWVDGMDEIDRLRVDKIEKSWLPVAKRQLGRISSRSLAPGLSRHDDYVADVERELDRCTTIGDFEQAMERMLAKWGSLTGTSPAFSAKRKAQLKALRDRTIGEAAEQRQRAMDTVESTLAPKREAVDEALEEQIRLAVQGVEELFFLPLDQGWPEAVEIRWTIIQSVARHLLARIDVAAEEPGRARCNRLHQAVNECFLRAYTSFKRFYEKHSKRVVEIIPQERLDEIARQEHAATQFNVGALKHQLDDVLLDAALVRRAQRHLQESGIFALSTAEGRKRFHAISQGMREGQNFDGFLRQLRRVPDLDKEELERVILTLNTEVEPFRTLYYGKLTLERYLKGLNNLLDR